MSEAAQPIAAVNATSNADAPASQQAESSKAKLEKVLWSVNDPDSDIVNGKGEDNQSAQGASGGAAPKTMGEIADKGIADANKGSGKTQKETELPTEEPAKEPGKKKYKFEGKEVEIADDRIDSYVQKGMLLDKKGYEISKAQNEAKSMMAEAQKQTALVQQTIEALQSGSLDVLVHMHGPEKARDMMEKFLTPLVREEQLPPEQRQMMQLQRERDHYKAQIEGRSQQEQQTKIESDTIAAKSHYEQVIVKALELGGVPKNEFTASEAASILRLGLDKGIDISPEQLSGMVKQNNSSRINAMTQGYTSQISEANKTGDQATILKAGQALADLLGPEVVYALGKYHYNKIKSAKPEMPRSPLDVAKQQITDKDQPRKRITEDDARKERLRRVAILEAGGDPGPA